MRLKVTITLNSLPLEDDKIKIENLNKTFKFRYVSGRVSPSEVTIGSNIINTVINTNDAFNLDYNTLSEYETQQTSNSFIFIGDFSDDLTETINTSSGRISVTIETIPDSFTITDTDFETFTSRPCDTINLNITANQDIAEIITPLGASYSPAINPIQVYVQRGLGQINVKIKNTSGDIAETYVSVPSLLNESMLTIIQTQVNSYTNIVITDITSGLSLEYKLNNGSWQSDSFFNGLTDGNYTLYVKDQYGCEIQSSFIVSADTTTSPHFYISKSNPIRYAQRIEWDNCANYKIDENSLSCETKQPIKYQEIQLFQKCDKIYTQFESNYDDIRAYVVTDVETVIPITRLTENINRSEKRDAKVITDSSGSYIYFTDGNIYDYSSGAVTGTHALNGELPEWAVLNGSIWINGVFYQIQEITFNENLNVYQIASPTALPTGDIIVGSIWNRENYEVYEFMVDFSSYDGYVRIKIVNNDANFPNILHLSELIEVREVHQNTIEIQYWFEENTDMLATEHRNKIRLKALPFEGLNDGEVEINKTDNSAYMFNGKTFELDRIVFENVTKEMMRKIDRIFKHKHLLIDGVGYVTKEQPEVEHLGESNLYDVIVVVLKKDSGIGITENSRQVEMPSLLEIDDVGYLEIK